jgi:hypothetical protein
MRARIAWPRSDFSFPPRTDCVASSPMSAPATKAFSPAPVRITTPQAGSALACAKAASMSAMTASFKAFNLSGRLTVIVAIRSTQA